MSFDSNYGKPAIHATPEWKLSLNSIGSNESIESKIKSNKAKNFLLRAEEAKRWIESFHCIQLENCDMIREEPTPFREENEQKDLIDLLMDGEYILRLITPFTSKKVTIHRNINLESRMGFMKATDNVTQFQDICKELGFPSTYIFSMSDLWERKNISKVIYCIHALAHYLEKKGLLKKHGYPTIQAIEANDSILYNDYLLKRVEFDLMKLNDEMNFDFDFDSISTEDILLEDQSEDSVYPPQCRVDAISNILKLEDELYLLIQLRNFKGEPITKSYLHGVAMDIENSNSNKLFIENMSFRDAGRGCYECKVKLQDYSFLPGEYVVHARIDGVELSPYRFVVRSGKPSALRTEIIDGSELYCDHFEGYLYQFTIIVKDESGNIITDEKPVNISPQLYYVLGKSKLKMKHATFYHYLNNGCYIIYFLTPLPGDYSLSLLLNKEVVKSFPINFNALKLEDIVMYFHESPRSTHQHAVIQGESFISSFAQESRPIWLSILTENRMNTSALSEYELSQLNNALTDVANTWLQNARSQAFQYYLDPKFHDPEFDGEGLVELREYNAGDTAWRIIQKFSPNREDILMEYLKNIGFISNNSQGTTSNQVSQIVIDDFERDWNEYDDMIKFQEEGRSQLSQPSHEGASDLLYELLHPHVCSLSFWVWCSNKIGQAKNNGKQKVKDFEGKVVTYEIKELILKEYAGINVFDCPRLCDIKLFSDIQLKVAQRFIFEIITDLNEHLLVRSYNMIGPTLEEEGKNVFNDFKKVHDIATAVITKTSFLGNSELGSEMTSDIKSNSKALMTTLRATYIQIIYNFIIFIKEKLLQNFLGFSKESISRVVSNVRLLAMKSNELWAEWNEIGYKVAASTSRKILVQHLQFPLPPNAFQKLKQTSGYSIQVPLNKYFDSTLESLFNVPPKVTKFPGLVNPWKVAFIKDSAVVFEGIRSGSLSTGASDEQVSKSISVHNTKELLIYAAMNQAKRFTREQLEDLNRKGSVLEIPFTSLSLMTPFFLPNREDRIALEHAQYLLGEFSRNETLPIHVDLHDEKPPMKLSVKFSKPVLVNFGTNIAMKTFKRGVVFQRMINCRKYGMRNFELKVNNFLLESGRQRRALRDALLNSVMKHFGNSREGQIYKQTIDDRAFNIERCYLLLEKKRVESLKKIQILDVQISQLQAKLEALISEKVIPNINNVTQLELVCKWKVGTIVSDILRMHHEIYKLEAQFQDMKELMTWDDQFVKELSAILTQRVIAADMFKEYSELFQREKDIWEMYTEVRELYHNYHHEDFAQSIIETSDVMKVDPYAISVRIALITFSLGEQFHFCCKSGQSRSGELHDQILEYCEWRYQFGYFPAQKTDKETFNKHRKAIHSIIALNGCTHELSRLNVGVPGSNASKNVSGRFLPGLFDKYCGLSGFEKISKPSIFSKEKLKKYQKVIYSECGKMYPLPEKSQ